jgi:hypothetical protein
MQTIIPTEVNGIKIRRYSDDSFGLVRKNRIIEEQFDLQFIRVPNELRWIAKQEVNDVGLLSCLFIDRPVYIIGKGPSLDSINEKYFDNKSPVICINDSIHQVEKLNILNPIYCVQQDSELKATCKPKRATLFISRQAKSFYAGCENTYVYIPEEYGLSKGALTVIVAIEMMKRFGANKFILMCFDACTQKKVAYAKCIGYPCTKFRKDAKRFLRHKDLIENSLAGYPTLWVTPENLL